MIYGKIYFRRCRVDYIAMKLNSPESLFANPTYPSGLVDGDSSIYKYAYPASKYPVIILPEDLHDNDGNSISNGYYSIALSDDKKFLLLIQSNNLRAKIPVATYKENDLSDEEKNELDDINKNIELAKEKHKLKKYKQAQLDLKNYYLRQQVKMKAEILDSQQGYYLIRYKNQNVNATGVILK